MYSIVRGCLIILCAILSILHGQGQNQSKADSIRSLIEKSDLGKEESMTAYHWLSAYSSSPEEKLHYGQLSLRLAKELNNQEYIIKANLLIGVAHRFKGDLGKSLEHLFASANDAASNKEYQSELANIYTEISTSYTQNGDSENALLYGSKTIGILRGSDQKQTLGLTLLNAGYDYYLIGNYDSAMAYYNESEPILEEINMKIGLAYIIGNRALVYWKNGNKEKAKKDLYQAIEMLEPFGDQYAMADYYNQLGTIYLEENDQEMAIMSTTKGLELAKEEGLKEQVRDASHLLFQLHQRSGQHKKAIDYLVQHYSYKDSIQNLETTQQLANLRTKFEVGQKQMEVDLLLEQKRNAQITIITGSIILFIVLCLVIIVYINAKAKAKLNKQLEKQKDSLIAVNHTKDKFFSIISHDLRGPVSILSGLISISRYFITDNKTEQLSDAMDKMESSVGRLVKLLDNLLKWALQQSGHFPYLPERLSVNEVLKEVIEMFRDMAVSKDIQLNVQYGDELLLYADRNTISTVFRNLLTNAIKFTPTDGRIDINVQKAGELAKIEFIDNGVGIPKEKLKTLFQLNENISTQGTKGEMGIGLGLHLVYDFIQLNEGEIKVKSELNKGTTFTLELPLNQGD